MLAVVGSSNNRAHGHFGSLPNNSAHEHFGTRRAVSAVDAQRSKFADSLRAVSDDTSVPASWLLGGFVCGVATRETLRTLLRVQRSVRWGEGDLELIEGFGSRSAALAAAFLWAPKRFAADPATELVVNDVGLCIVDDLRRRDEFRALLAMFPDPAALCAELLTVLATPRGPADPVHRAACEQLLRRLQVSPPASEYPQMLRF